MKKAKGFEFRKMLKHKINEESIYMLDCRSKSSPQCLGKFNKTRVEQTMCIKCMAFNDLFDTHPLLKVED